MPFVLIAIIYFFMRNKKWIVRYPIMILSGWAILLIFVVSLTTYSVHYAPTKELMEIAASGDGAPNVLIFLFGWIFAFIFLLLLEFINKALFYIYKWFNKENK